MTSAVAQLMTSPQTQLTLQRYPIVCAAFFADAESLFSSDTRLISNDAKGSVDFDINDSRGQSRNRSQDKGCASEAAL
jgi:hypothetical protein